MLHHITPIIRKWLTKPLPDHSDPNDWQGPYTGTGLGPKDIANVMNQARLGQWDSFFKNHDQLMISWPHYVAVASNRKRAVQAMEPHIHAASEHPQDQDMAHTMRTALLDSGLLQGCLPGLLDAFTFGFAAAEIHWHLESHRWSPAHIETIPQRAMGFESKHNAPTDSHGGFGIMLEHNLTPIPPAKAIIFRPNPTARPQPIMEGYAWNLLWSWMLARFTMEAWIEFAERFGKPLKLGKYHRGASIDERKTLRRALISMGRDAGAVIPQEMQVEFVEAAGRPGQIHEPLMHYLDRAASKLILGQETTTEAISGGHAVGREHNQVRGEIADADAAALASCLNQQLIAPIVALNSASARPPTLTFKRPQQLAEYRANVQLASSQNLPVDPVQFYAITGLKPPSPSASGTKPSASPTAMDHGSHAR